MRRTKKLLVVIPLAAVLSFAGPPANGHSAGGSYAPPATGHSFAASPGPSIHGHSFNGTVPLTGPPPVGAAGSPPLNAVGSLHFGSGFNQAYNGSRNGFREDHHTPVNRHPNRSTYAFFGVPYFAPYYGFDNGYYDSSYYGDNGAPGPYDNYPDPATQQMLMNQDALGQQVQDLTAEIQDLKARQQQGEVPPYLQPNGPGSNVAPPAAVRPPDADAQNNDVPVTVVLRSGQQLTIRNYAVTDGTFWDFSKQPAQKIPVSAIDVAASEKATQASGGEFPALTP